MSVLGENRSGPNQDINDPTLLNQLRQGAQLSFDKLRDIQNTVSGIVGDSEIITTLFSHADGSTQGVSERLQGDDEISGIVSQSVIHTYINQPERFRDFYGNLINNTKILGQSPDNNFPTFVPLSTVVTPIYKEVELPGTTFDRRWRRISPTIGSYVAHGGSESLNNEFHVIDGLDQLTIPDWSGVGPTNYNSGTFPQLINEYDQYTNVMGSGFKSVEDNLVYLGQTIESQVAVASLLPDFLNVGWLTRAVHTSGGAFPLGELLSDQGVSKTTNMHVELIAVNGSATTRPANYSASAVSNGGSSSALTVNDMAVLDEVSLINRTIGITVLVSKLTDTPSGIINDNLLDSKIGQLTLSDMNNAAITNLSLITSNSFVMEPFSIYRIVISCVSANSYRLSYTRQLSGPAQISDDHWIGDALPSVSLSITVLGTTFAISAPRVLQESGW